MREKWWRAQYGMVEAFEAQCGVAESVSGVMVEREKREVGRRRLWMVGGEGVVGLDARCRWNILKE